MKKKKKKKKKCNVFLRKVINYPSNEISNNRACINISKKKKKKNARKNFQLKLETSSSNRKLNGALIKRIRTSAFFFSFLMYHLRISKQESKRRGIPSIFLWKLL